jgi:pyrroline-5-carboxylate reductase
MLTDQTLATHNIAIIGAGTMGRAIATGMARANIIAPERLAIADRTVACAESLAQQLGARAVHRNAEACRDAEIVILCVKPNDMAAVLHDLKDRDALWPRATIISIAAGVTTAMIEQWTGSAVAVVRAMPNTPCMIGKGMTVLARGTHATDEHLAIAHTIFSTLGRCITLEEKHMNVVTSLSGSGPAFIYVMMESLADGAVMCGLPRHVATEMVAQVALGSAEMVLDSGKHPSALKDEVTTPGGCTIAGLLTLEDGKIRSVLARAVECAANVAGGLGGGQVVATVK